MNTLDYVIAYADAINSGLDGRILSIRMFKALYNKYKPITIVYKELVGYRDEMRQTEDVNDPKIQDMWFKVCEDKKCYFLIETVKPY